MYNLNSSNQRGEGNQRVNRTAAWFSSSVTTVMDEAPVKKNSYAPTFSAGMHQLPDHRKQLIFRIRRQIAENTYDTPDKLKAALERMFDTLPWANRLSND